MTRRPETGEQNGTSAVEPAAEPVTQPSEGPRILVVEDDASISQLVKHVLKKMASEIVSVTSAEDAIVELQSSHWDLLLADIGLPGMNGLDLTEHARRAYPNLPIIVMTANVHGGVDREAHSRGADAFVAKPFAPSALRATVGGLLDTPR